MKLLEFFFQWQKANKRVEPHTEEYYAESEYMRGLDRGIEIGLRMASQVDRMALDMARTDGIEEILKRFNENARKV